MKYNIKINQKAIVDNWFNLDIIDWAILNYIEDFSKSERLAKIIINWVEYFWIQYEHMIKEMPMLWITNKQALKNRVDKIVGCWILEKHLLNGNSTYFRFWKKYELLISDSIYDAPNENKGGGMESVGGQYGNNRGGSMESVGIKHNTNNSSTINNNNIINNNTKSEDFEKKVMEDANKVLLKLKWSMDRVSKAKKELSKTKKREDIDLLIQTLKNYCSINNISYDKTRERMFWRHIMDWKDYWEFVESIGQDRIEFALNILKASIKINYWKWVCSWPMKIYQNYSDVYNKTKMESSKKKSTVWFLPSYQW